ncbi:hypothetical protein H5410_036197, partial [Solanum commersonii]
MRTLTEESQMMRMLDGSLAEFRGRVSEINSRLTKVEDEILAKVTGFTLPSYVIREDVGVESALILKDHELQANRSHSSLPHSISLLLQDPCTMETENKTYPPKGKVTLESSMRTPTEESRMKRMLEGSLVEFRGRLSEINSRLTKVYDEIWAKDTGFTLPSYVEKAKFLLAEHKEIREDMGVESALIHKDHELQANRSLTSLPHSISLLLQDP